MPLLRESFGPYGLRWRDRRRSHLSGVPPFTAFPDSVPGSRRGTLDRSSSRAGPGAPSSTARAPTRDRDPVHGTRQPGYRPHSPGRPPQRPPGPSIRHARPEPPPNGVRFAVGRRSRPRRGNPPLHLRRSPGRTARHQRPTGFDTGSPGTEGVRARTGRFLDPHSPGRIGRSAGCH